MRWVFSRVVVLSFQSTPPARGATTLSCIASYLAVISIHAPREGGDLVPCAVPVAAVTISIHAPREGGDIFNRNFFAVSS